MHQRAEELMGRDFGIVILLLLVKERDFLLLIMTSSLGNLMLVLYINLPGQS